MGEVFSVRKALSLKSTLSLILCLCLVVGMIPAVSAAPEEAEAAHYSYVDIVNQMLDMEHLARLPQAGETSGEWTSYDRSSRYDEENDVYVSWHSNGDGGGYSFPQETTPKGNRRLVADLEGPGVMWRIWSAQAENGLIEIYIDGEEEPTISKPFSQLFTGTDDVFAYRGLSYNVSQGKNCYLPITYNESCKVYLYSGWGNYYEFTYSTLAEGATVESMPKAFSDSDKAALSRVNDFFRSRLGENPTDISEAKEAVKKSVAVPAGGNATALDFVGDGAIAQFIITPDSALRGLSRSAAMQYLKELTVSMYWDGEEEPSVWAPLCDFFGDPTGDEEYYALPMGYNGEEFYCYMYMPFKSGAKIVIGNDGDAAKNVGVDIAVVPLKGNADDYMRFHAKWQRGFYSERTDKWPDYSVLKADGAGRFLGFSLHVYQNTQGQENVPGYGTAYWWGEGDEKFFVDGEKFPSSFGTGSEDYFGYAWCDPNYFTAPYHAQPLTAENGVHGVGHKSNVRFQLTDNVPFFDSFDGYMEKYYKTYTDWSTTSYWYLASGDEDTYKPQSLETRTNYYGDKNNNVVPGGETIYQGENMEFAFTAGATLNQQMSTYSSFGWGNGGAADRRQLLWYNAGAEKEIGVGDSITFTFNSVKNLKGALKMAYCKGSDFGIHKIYLDGEPIAGEVDSYNAKVTNTSEIILGNVELSKGSHTLTVEVAGKNENSSGYFFALDRLVIDSIPVEPGVFEGENMELLGVTTGIACYQNMGVGSGTWETAGTYSKKRQLWWTTSTSGSLALDGEIALALDLPQDVDSEMIMYFTKANDYGRFQLFVDGAPVGEEVDLYDTNVVRSAAVSFGNVQLSAGRHVFTFKAVGRNASSRNYMFGLDNIVFPDYGTEPEPTHYSYVDIANQLLELEHLSLLPQPGEKGAQWTSYDRASRYDAETDTYINWSVNGDWTGYIENVGDNRYLVADIEGPGVIWRIWSANPNGTLEICIDGATYAAPTITNPFSDAAMFSGTAAQRAPLFNFPALAYITAQGRNSFVPISFNESCKVYLKMNAPWSSCYNIFNYSILPEGSTVESLTGTLTEDQKAALQNVNDFIADQLGDNPNDLSEGDRLAGDFEVKAGEAKTVVNYSGEGAIAEFKVKLTDDMDYSDLCDALQALTVSMYWDGEEKPSVWGPLGDFFGTPFGDPYATIPVGLRRDEWFYCYYYMPFATDAKVVIGNEGTVDYNLSVDATVVPLTYSIDSYTRFHAKWHRGFYSERADKQPDYSVLRVQGQGRFLGFMQHVYEKGSYGWWGEGDEKFFVDGEKFPSLFGTGSEDYFGYAWCDPTVFNSRPLHAQPHNEGGIGDRGNKINLRHQTVDNVPFNESFDGYIEKYHSNSWSEYSEMPYWYLSVDGVDSYEPVPLAERKSWFEMPGSFATWTEAEDATNVTVSVSEDKPEPTRVNQSGSSGSNPNTVRWANTSADGEIFFSFNVPRKTGGLLTIRAVYGNLFGIYQFYIDGEPIGSPVDFYTSRPGTSNRTAASPYITLGAVEELAKGIHVLSAKPVGKNESAEGYYLGLDGWIIEEPEDTGKIECEYMTLVNAPYGTVNIQGMSGFAGTFSGEQVWWTGVGGFDRELVLGFTLDEAVEDTVLFLNYCRAVDYGIFQAYLDGEPIGAPQDAYATGGVYNRELAVDIDSLEAGYHELKVVVTGTNPNSTGDRRMVGLDYIRFGDYPVERTFEAEAMTWTVTPAAGANAWVQTMVPNYAFRGWSGGKQVLWQSARLDQTVEFVFDVRTAVSGMLKLAATKANDFGIFDVYMDGELLGQIDTYNPVVISFSSFLLGEVELSKGRHVIKFVSVGKNEKSGGYLLGFDCFFVDPNLPVANVIEGEDMEVLLCTGGNPVVQSMAQEWPAVGPYSNGSQVWWIYAVSNGQSKNYEVGDKLVLALDLEEDVDAEMVMAFTKAADYGIFQLSLDGKKLGGPIDFHNSSVIRSVISFGRAQLEAGRHYLEVEIVGSTRGGVNDYMFALDCIAFAPFDINAEVVPTTIVNGCAANVKVNVDTSGLDENDVVTVSLFEKELTVVNGSVLFRFAVADVPAAGRYKPVVKVNGEEVNTSAVLEVVPLDDDIWTVSVIPGVDETILAFHADIAPKTGTNFIVLVNGATKTFTRDGNNLILPYVVQAGDTIVVKNVKYPILFPSYSFTFTATYSPE